MASIPHWTREDDKNFELALMKFPEGSPYFLENIAYLLQKPLEEVKYYYDALVYDVALIESGKVSLPKYPEDDNVSLAEAISKSKNKDTVKKKGIPWTPNEHRLFLDGLKKYGKGDWKSISRKCVKSRNPMQVASHAQKYFLRINSDSNKKGKRSSIHDITLGDDADNVTVPGSNLESMDQQQPFLGDQIPPDQHYSQEDNFGIFYDDGSLASFDLIPPDQQPYI